MGVNVTDVLREGDRIVGVQAKTGDGILDVHAKLVVGADGRSSTVRAKAGLEVIDTGARSTSSGFASRGKPTILRKPSASSAPASSWCSSTAKNTGSAAT